MTKTMKMDLNEIRQCLADGADVNAKDNSGWTALMRAVWWGDVKCMSLLLKHGADVNATNNNKNTALSIAGMTGKADCVKLLLEHGADVDAKDNNGWTALIYASANGKTDCVKLLLKHRADVNAKDNSGWTALIHASEKDNIGCIKLLIDHLSCSTEDTKMNDNNMDLLRRDAVSEIVEYLENATPNVMSGEIVNEIFNSGYYATSKSEAEDKLNRLNVFRCVRIVRDYELLTFGEVYTDISDPKQLLNVLFYIIGEEELSTINDIGDAKDRLIALGGGDTESEWRA